jgi:hypothetical protein
MPKFAIINLRACLIGANIAVPKVIHAKASHTFLWQATLDG